VSLYNGTILITDGDKEAKYLNKMLRSDDFGESFHVYDAGMIGTDNERTMVALPVLSPNGTSSESGNQDVLVLGAQGSRTAFYAFAGSLSSAFVEHRINAVDKLEQFAAVAILY